MRLLPNRVAAVVAAPLVKWRRPCRSVVVAVRRSPPLPVAGAGAPLRRTRCPVADAALVRRKTRLVVGGLVRRNPIRCAPRRRGSKYVCRKSPKRSKRRKSSARRRRTTHRRVMTAGPEYIGAAEFLENPLSGGELLLAGITATVGYALTDFLDRWLAAKELTSGGTAVMSGQAGLTPGMASLSKPGIWRILAQAGAAAVPFLGAYYVHEPKGRAALQGAGLGALIHLGGQLVQHFVIAKLVAGSAPAAGGMMATVNGWYTPELIADNASDMATTGTAGTLIAASTGVAATGSIGLAPRGAPRAHMVPRALGAPAPSAAPAQGVGACGDASGPAAAAAAAWAAGGGDCGGKCGEGEPDPSTFTVTPPPCFPRSCPDSRSSPARHHGHGRVRLRVAERRPEGPRDVPRGRLIVPLLENEKRNETGPAPD